VEAATFQGTIITGLGMSRYKMRKIRRLKGTRALAKWADLWSMEEVYLEKHSGKTMR
jgi:hypothetical protein